jgi:cytoskeletal protein CcmA (bactofilin family)
MPDVVRIKTLEEKEIDTVLAEDIDFEGTLSFEKPLMVKGKFKGEIKASGDLYIGENAVVEAKVMANLVSIKGTIKGDIQAKTQVELFSTAVVVGDIETPNLEIERGSQLNGTCKMIKRSTDNKNEFHTVPQANPQVAVNQNSGNNNPMDYNSKNGN